MGGKEIGGRYSLEKKIGEGSMATVYRARDRKAGNRRVALKVLKLKKDTDPFLMEALKREFATLTQLNHLNLAKVYDFAAYNRQWVLSEEYVEGRDFLNVCQRANLNTVFELIVQGLRALDYLHAHGYLHLDLKPENLIVGKANSLGTQHLKVIDFGLAREQKEWKTDQSDLSGTLPYVAPEIFLGGDPSPASDLYSWAMILYKIFSGAFPFTSQDPDQIFQEQIYGHGTVSYPLNPALPERLGDFLLQCLVKDPAARPQRVGDFLQGLNGILGEDFTLRSPRFLGNILAESSFILRPEVFRKLEKQFLDPKPKLFQLTGHEGSGKTYLASRLKERLQLQGRHPIWIQGKKHFQELEKSALKHFTHIFLEVLPGEKISEAQHRTLSALPALILDPSGVPISGAEKIKLSSVEKTDLKDFLKQEIRFFPEKHLSEVWEQTGGNPGALGRYLQALRELGWILWDDHGWRWIPEAAGDLSRVWQLQETLWRERLIRVEEALRHTPLGLGSHALAGILEVEEEFLKAFLEQWVRNGQLEVWGGGSEPLYRLPKSAASSAEVETIQDWDWVLAELQKDYAGQKYQVGIHWVEQIKKAGGKEIPPPVRLWGARHLVALGRAAEALEFLPPSPPRPLPECGLYHEIQSRANLLLGIPDKNQSHCNEAMVAYQKVEDFAGVARIHNLRALIAKRKGELIPAEDLLQKAVLAAETSQDHFLVASMHLNLANWCFDRGLLEKAASHYEAALKNIASDRHPVFFAVLLHNWVNFLFHLGKTSLAEESAYRWLRHSLTYHQVEQQAIALNYLSLLADQRGNPDEQERYLKQSLALLNTLPTLTSPHLHPQVLLNRAYSHWDRKQTLPAQLDAEKALEMAEALSHRYLIASTHLFLGKVYRCRKRPDSSKARWHLGRAHQLIRDQQFRQLLWEVEFEMGLTEEQKGNFVSAGDHYQRAHESLNLILQSMTEAYRRYFLRDRKQEKIEEALRRLGQEAVP